MSKWMHEEKCHAIATALHARTGADVYVWFDPDSNRFRCRWRGDEFSPQMPHMEHMSHEDNFIRIVTAWRQEMVERLK